MSNDVRSSSRMRLHKLKELKAQVSLPRSTNNANTEFVAVRSLVQREPRPTSTDHPRLTAPRPAPVPVRSNFVGGTLSPRTVPTPPGSETTSVRQYDSDLDCRESTSATDSVTRILHETDVALEDQSEILAQQRVYSSNEASKAVTLGYDWIAAMLENTGESGIESLSDEFFEEINHFRQVNHKDCVCPTLATDDEWSHEKHGVHRPNRELGDAGAFYRIDRNLNAVPVQGGRLKLPPELDKYVCVSVPHHVVLSHEQETRVKPKLRVEKFDPNKSFNLSTHCEPGCETVGPSGVTVQKLLGLESSLQSKHHRDHTDPSGELLRRLFPLNADHLKG